MNAMPAQAIVDSVANVVATDAEGGMAAAHWIRLFTNNVAPTKGMDSTTFVFGSQSLAGLGATSISATTLVINPGSLDFSGIPTLVNGGTFIGTATTGYPVTIYGYAAVGSDSITPIYAERLTAPVTIVEEGQFLKINAGMTWGPNFIG